MSRGRLFGTLCSMVFLVNLARVMFAPLLEPLIGVFGMSESVAGVVATLVWVGSAVPRLPTGWLLTRFERHRVVLAVGGVLAGAAFFTATATSVPHLAAGAFLMGLASGVYFVAANPLVSELYPERVGWAMGFHGGAAQVAAVGAAPFVTVALATFAWQATFVAVGVAAAAVAVALFVAARGADLPDAGVDDRDLLGAAVAERRTVLLGVVILGLTGFVWQGLFNFYELYMQQKAVSDTVAKNLLTVIFGAGVPAFFLSGRLADRFPHVPYLLTIVGAFVTGVLVLTQVSGFVSLVVVSAALGYVIHSLFPAMDAFLLDTLPDHHRGSAYATYSAGMMLVQATGSSAVGILRDLGYTYDGIFVGMAVGLGTVLLVLVALELTGHLPGRETERAAVAD